MSTSTLLAPRVNWFFGRGLSIGCGLSWSVPEEWRKLPRKEQVARIKTTLATEMSESTVNTTDIRNLLGLLAANTAPSWKHQFHTTNWDYLLQREILALGLTVLPDWCANSHVYHLNGTVEVLGNYSNRSCFVLESDVANARAPSIEVNKAFNKLMWDYTFVVVGMSFECEVDKYLLRSFQKVQDDLPIGESQWIIVNPDAEAVAGTCARLRTALPNAKINAVVLTFRAWLESGLPELQECGAITLQTWD